MFKREILFKFKKDRKFLLVIAIVLLPFILMLLPMIFILLTSLAPIAFLVVFAYYTFKLSFKVMKKVLPLMFALMLVAIKFIKPYIKGGLTVQPRR